MEQNVVYDMTILEITVIYTTQYSCHSFHRDPSVHSVFWRHWVSHGSSISDVITTRVHHRCDNSCHHSAHSPNTNGWWSVVNCTNNTRLVYKDILLEQWIFIHFQSRLSDYLLLFHLPHYHKRMASIISQIVVILVNGLMSVCLNTHKSQQ